ncbi:hypothetical protein RHGRI_034579 [Rhododendron griersonianum]|uniref:Uncharacterized protein n=1 Tax=Rhododendron griersonianum TaxID=479676 RepID=A0AAV6I201_9ERIC|nr:hypothetical protein RHGRI_034579 [Rhododendron griersonianum]
MCSSYCSVEAQRPGHLTWTGRMGFETGPVHRFGGFGDFEPGFEEGFEEEFEEGFEGGFEEEFEEGFEGGLQLLLLLEGAGLLQAVPPALLVELQ